MSAKPKVYQDGNEIKGAEVTYNEDNTPASVFINGVQHNPANFTFEEEKKEESTMIVLRDGKEVEGAQVFFDANGGANYVRVEGVNYDASAFTFKDVKLEKKTKPATTKAKQNTQTDAKSKSLVSKVFKKK